VFRNICEAGFPVLGDGPPSTRTLHAQSKQGNSMNSPLDQIKHPFLDDLPAPYLRFLTEAANLKRFASGEIIIAEGDEAELFYLIIEGQVTLESFVPGWGTLAVQTLGAGDALGWSWLFPPYRWRFGARAIDGAETLALDARRLRELADKEPAFGVELLKRITRIVIDRLHATRLQLVARLPGLT
jgi:CRP-like cAMP-binding protein